jgi:hypothetical protein
VDRLDLCHLSTDYGYQWVTLRVGSDDTRASETLQVSWDGDGFTLIDLLLVIVIVIVGIISVPLANVVLGYLRGTDATTARLAELRRSIEPTAATRAVTTGEPGAGKLNSPSVTTTSASSCSPLMGVEALFRSLETDASAFVAKTASTAEVLTAIGHAAVATSSFTAAGLAPALAWRRASTTGRGSALARARCCTGSGTVCPYQRSPAPCSFDHQTYVARPYMKLGASNRAHAVTTGVRCGLIEYDAHMHVEALSLTEASIPTVCIGCHLFE